VPPKQPRKTFSLGSIEITPREILLGIVALFVLVSLGLIIANAISSSIQETNELYYTSLKVDNDPNLLAYGMKTNVGRSMSYGEFSAVQPVRFNELSGDYFYVERLTERYTMHTRTVTTTDSKGKQTTRTETYYTWDDIKREYQTTNEFNFLQKTFKTSQIEIPSSRGISLSDSTVSSAYQGWVSWGYIYEGGDFYSSVGDLRYSYSGVPKGFNGTLFSNLANNTISGVNRDRAQVFYERNITEALDEIESSGRATIVIFWIVYSIFIVGAIIGLFALENKWLEDK
jgi:hypothetical protein